jgi:hypothetical protein
MGEHSRAADDTSVTCLQGYADATCEAGEAGHGRRGHASGRQAYILYIYKEASSPSIWEAGEPWAVRGQASAQVSPAGIGPGIPGRHRLRHPRQASTQEDAVCEAGTATMPTRGKATMPGTA